MPIPTKKFTHSGLLSINRVAEQRCYQHPAQLIDMGQATVGGWGYAQHQFLFCVRRCRCRRKICVSAPVAFHVADAQRQIAPVADSEP